MKQSLTRVGDMPALLFGERADRVLLCVHGLFGRKEEMEDVAGIVCPRGFQVLAVDLPGHGERDRREELTPWQAVPELKTLCRFALDRWNSVSLYAVSIGAWLSLIATARDTLKTRLLLAPMLDMAGYIENIMRLSGVTDEQLERRGSIPVEGTVLSWRYLCFARENRFTQPIENAHVLIAENDEVTGCENARRFCETTGARLTVMPKGEHWFHTPDELAARNAWLKEVIGK